TTSPARSRSHFCSASAEPRPDGRRHLQAWASLAANRHAANATALANPCRMRSTDAAFEADRNQLLCLDSKLHRQLLQHVLDEAVDDQCHRFFLRKSALS